MSSYSCEARFGFEVETKFWPLAETPYCVGYVMADEYPSYKFLEKLLQPKPPRPKALYKQVKDSLSPRDHAVLEKEWHVDSKSFMPQTPGGVIDVEDWGLNLEKHLQRLSDAYIKAKPWERLLKDGLDFKFFKVLETLLTEELYNKWKSIKKNSFLHNSPDDSDEMKAHRENNLNWNALNACRELGSEIIQ